METSKELFTSTSTYKKLIQSFKRKLKKKGNEKKNRKHEKHRFFFSRCCGRDRPRR